MTLRIERDEHGVTARASGPLPPSTTSRRSRIFDWLWERWFMLRHPHWYD